MSADVLRRAASLIRERADEAVSGTGSSDWFADRSVVRSSGGLVCESSSFEAEHIASWHPAVALTVADGLDAMAAVIEEAGDGPLALVAAGLAEPFVAVARVYLGESS